METKAEIKVAAIYVKLGAQTVELTLKEARALRDALCDALGNPPPASGLTWWPPVIISAPDPPPPYTITCGTSWR